MEKEEVELVPSGLISCLLNDNEVRILKISPNKFTIRVSEKIGTVRSLKVAFYVFNEYRYEEIVIKNYDIFDERKEEFFYIYKFSVKSEEYIENVRRVFREYHKYIMLKAFGDENEFSKEMVSYPSELDYEFYNSFKEQKKEWLSELNYRKWNNNVLNSFELAISIDNFILYNQYLSENIEMFKDHYLKSNYVSNHKLLQKEVTRIYIGNEFCHNLFPDIKLLMEIIEKARKDKLDITIVFTYLRDCYIDKTHKIIEEVYNWCVKNNTTIEIIVNDWGMLKMVENKNKYFTLSLGSLLNKRKKDPRYVYKKGYIENKERMSQNSLNSNVFTKFLKENKITRYEYESCGYKMNIAKGKHSMHIPFYVTNTSQFCTLYAMCEKLDRGNQQLVNNCNMYCREYIFAYPKHLRMVGKYNSLFAFDDTLLKDYKMLEEYISSGIDRIVLNFI